MIIRYIISKSNVFLGHCKSRSSFLKPEKFSNHPSTIYHPAGNCCVMQWIFPALRTTSRDLTPTTYRFDSPQYMYTALQEALHLAFGPRSSITKWHKFSKNVIKIIQQSGQAFAWHVMYLKNILNLGKEIRQSTITPSWTNKAEIDFQKILVLPYYFKRNVPIGTQRCFLQDQKHIVCPKDIWCLSSPFFLPCSCLVSRLSLSVFIFALKGVIISLGFNSTNLP